ncbi:cytochrome P450 [uncultured Jatrophihabitans sp.]|uniref:cytochrome P450 n=1 Tax=uncultured Jatrophihabitans sp. TaxID=1610747 RepID=UPI0035CBD273
MSLIDRYGTRRELPAQLDLPPGSRLPKAVQTVLFLTKGPFISPRWQRRFGDVFSMDIAPAGRSVVLSRPEHVREIFAGAADTFHAGEGNAILGPIMGEHSVLLLDEEEHRLSRKRIMAAFHGETLQGWSEVVERIAADDVATWPTGQPVGVHQHMNDVSLEVILRVVFGLSAGERLDALRPRLQQLVRVGPMIFVGWLFPRLQAIGPWRRFARLKDDVDRLLYTEIAERRTAADLGERTDVLSKLLHAAPEQSDAELRDHLVTLLLAGHETTASTLAWTLHDLARRPELLARVQRAADEGDDAYLEATVKESMRLRPVIRNIARRLAKPARVAGYDLPAGVMIFPSIALVHQRADVWDEPAEFRPERFLGASPPPATWIPFGGGLRRCLGAGLASVEAIAVLKTVLRSVDLAPVGRPERHKARNVTIVPARGARLVTYRRSRAGSPAIG